MTGWRIGYTASSKELAALMTNIQSHMTSNPNSVAQKAALEAIAGPQDAVREMVAEYERRRDYICERIAAIPNISCAKPEGAFYAFVNIDKLLNRGAKKIHSAGGLAEKLLNEAKVVVIPCEDFGADNYIRLSYATSMDEIKRGMDRLEKYIIDNFGE
jgi:aspartate aminotransferase